MIDPSYISYLFYVIFSILVGYLVQDIQNLKKEVTKLESEVAIVKILQKNVSDLERDIKAILEKLGKLEG